MCWNQSCSWYVKHIYVVTLSLRCRYAVVTLSPLTIVFSHVFFFLFFLPLLPCSSSSSCCCCLEGIKKGATYLFTQRRTSSYYHPIGFAWGADGALDDQPELEPGICPGQTRDGPELDCDCNKPADGAEFADGDVGLCPAPMYIRGSQYLGKYSNNVVIAPINANEDFGLDVYEPEFVVPLLQWKTAAEGSLFTQERSYYQVALNIPTDIEPAGTFYAAI